jgi:hypothetical protein
VSDFNDVSENWLDQADLSSLSGEARQLYTEMMAEMKERLATPESRARRDRLARSLIKDAPSGLSREEAAVFAAVAANAFANVMAVVETVAVFLTERFEPKESSSQ